MKSCLMFAGLLAIFALAVALRAADPSDDQEGVDRLVRELKARSAAALQHLKDFDKALPTAKDPVALAIPLAKEPVLEVAVAGMDVLAEHWSDPRSEETLRELSEGKRTVMRDGILTIAGEAAARLFRVRGRRGAEEILKGCRTDAEKWAKIQATFELHPDWLKKQYPEDTSVPSRLIQIAKEVGGAKALPLIVESGEFPLGDPYFAPYRQELYQYAKEMGRDKAFAHPYFINLLEGRSVEKTPDLFEEWLKTTDQPEQMERLVQALRNHLNRLKVLLREDPRPAVRTAVLAELAYCNPTDEKIQVIEDFLKRRKAEGADPVEVTRIERYIQTARKYLPKPRGTEKQP